MNSFHIPQDGDGQLEQVLADYLRSVESGQPLDPQQLIAKHSDLADELRSFFANRAALDRVAQPLKASAVEPTVGMGTAVASENSTSIRYFGDYELLEEIARGGMGVVYKARQASLNRVVAVKMILAGTLADELAVKRFRQEAEAAANLDHPHIVPVYEVGEYQGQQYFSMGFVEGQSLSARLAGGPLAPREAAELMEQVARAVQYAHEHGVIHRDLKPANVLLDRDGRPRVTDFGLAKLATRDQSLTDTGQVLGTPGYMPPEQVDGKPAGPKADVYGLGAILYALLTGRPPFQTATPMETMLQVLSADPVPPRQLNPSIPRDLDTIARKCLEKWPDWRYESAAELADELRRFLAGEPIRARRTGLAEQGVRWFRKQRRSVALAAGAAATTVVLAVVGVAGWLWYQDWRLGRLMLKTDRPPVVAELLNERDELAVPSFTIPTQEALAVPADEYRLRVSQADRFSQTYQLTVPRGLFPAELSLNLDDQLVASDSGGTELRIERAFALATRQRRTDVILLGAKGIERSAWPGGGEPWSLALDKPENEEQLAAAPGFRWIWFGGANANSYYTEANVLFQPQVLRDAPDINGDGSADVIVAGRHQAWILAVSGRDGKIIWLVARGADVASDHLQGQPPATWPSRNPSAVLGLPQVVGDHDKDGVPDLLANFGDDRGNPTPDNDATKEQAPQRWLECLSGKTGQTIWRFDYDPAWFKLPAGIEIPARARWLLSINGHGSGGGGYSDDRGDVSRNYGGVQVYGEQRLAPLPPVTTTVDGRELALTVAGTRLIGLDVATGKPVWEPTKIGRPAVHAPRIADCDGDGHSELVVVQQVPDQPASPNAMQLSEEFEVSVWPLATAAEPRWRYKFHGRQLAPWKIWSPAKPWPVIEDLDGDGRPEVVVPNATWDPMRLRWLKEIELLDGATGQSRWRRMLKMMDPQIEDFLAGPDIDGDGHREVFAATLVGNRYDVYVDALSGQDGRTICWGSRRIGYSSFINGVSWWHPAEDGWPQLLVHTVPETLDRPPALLAFSAGTAAFTGLVTEISDFQLADADGDGLDDLFAYKFARPDEPNGGQLQVIRGVANERWRRAGGKWQAAADYDGDGHGDLLAVFPSGFPEVAAISGREGRQLWRTTIEWGPSSWQPWTRPLSFDLDGDSVSDIIVYHGPTGGGASAARTNFPVVAVSGRTGQWIWQVTQLFSSIEGCLFVDAHDLENDGSPEIIFSTFTDWDYPRNGGTSSAWQQHWLAVVDGRTGAFRWRQPLSIQYGLIGPGGVPTASNDQTRGADVHPAVTDVNGDGVADVIMPAEATDAPGKFELRAMSGRDGSTLWRRPFADSASAFAYVREIWQDAVTPVICDLDGDRKAEVLGLEYYVTPSTNAIERRFARLFALDAQSGRELWKWEGEVERHCGQAGEDPNRQAAKPRPIVLPRRDGRPLVAIGLWGWYQPGRVVVLDHAGQFLTEHKIPVSQLNFFTLRGFDLHGDENDQLVLCESDWLSAVEVRRPSDGKPYETHLAWKWPFPSGSPQRFVDALAGRDGAATTLVVQSRTSLYGISAATGEVQWINAGPQPRDVAGLPIGLEASMLSTADRAAPPPAIFQWKDQFVACRSAITLPLATEAATVPAQGRQVRRATWSDDPRLQRKQMWAQDRDRPRDLRRIAWGLLLATCLLWLPGRTLLRIVKRRQFGLNTLFLIPLLLGLSIALLTLPVHSHNPFVTDSTAQRYQLAVLELPVILCAGILIQLARRGRWRWLAGFVLGGLTLALLAQMATRLLEARHLGPGERFAWTDLDVPLLIGFYATSWVVVIVAALSATVYGAKKADR